MVIFKGVVWAMLLCSMPLVAACKRAPPEQALRETIAGLQEAIEARDADAVSEVIAEDFVGNDGIDRQGVRHLAIASFLQHRQLGLTLGPLEVAMQGDAHARVEFTAAATAGGGALLPQSAQVYQMQTGWRVVDGDWRLVSADWSPKL